MYLAGLSKKKKKKVNVHYNHANARQCKNIDLKKLDTFDCILENTEW